MFSLISNWFTKTRKCLKRFKGVGFRKILPLIYLLLLLLGLVLTIIYAFVHSFVICSSLFGTNFCTPTGIYIALLASIPGYIISGNILYYIGEIPWLISFIVVIITSLVFYYLVGLIIDKYKSKSPSFENISKIIIIIFFCLLFLFFISLINSQ